MIVLYGIYHYQICFCALNHTGCNTQLEQIVFSKQLKMEKYVIGKNTSSDVNRLNLT